MISKGIESKESYKCGSLIYRKICSVLSSLRPGVHHYAVRMELDSVISLRNMVSGKNKKLSFHVSSFSQSWYYTGKNFQVKWNFMVSGLWNPLESLESLLSQTILKKSGSFSLC